jgi:hypothetical protein
MCILPVRAGVAWLFVKADCCGAIAGNEAAGGAPYAATKHTLQLYSCTCVHVSVCLPAGVAWLFVKADCCGAVRGNEAAGGEAGGGTALCTPSSTSGETIRLSLCACKE